MSQGVFAIGSGQVLLRWLPENPLFTFNIYWGVGPSASTILTWNILQNNIAAGSGPYNEFIANSSHGVSIGTTYFFYITATGPDGIEGPGSPVQGITVI